ncbi:uncharacterized protein ASCRUDRAFT_77908 [Ascoidea rubescens DSM 1968]|uniref:Uncharacterized protein n=1 Tax=Ascoidea rubescens DSM 1968 TaxID=1344418 RepID=A0A1D2V9X1_9ASCO|nr:hypothetical protein ASCRUDRAFT_77908 [Ascoidea rubescens DSM 1968]ODV58434.1 hypothetical protein ASCRUDRAFT_77908 [Ascoidea rubescens DSM 1968]
MAPAINWDDAKIKFIVQQYQSALPDIRNYNKKVERWQEILTNFNQRFNVDVHQIRTIQSQFKKAYKNHIAKREYTKNNDQDPITIYANNENMKNPSLSSDEITSILDSIIEQENLYDGVHKNINGKQKRKRSFYASSISNDINTTDDNSIKREKLNSISLQNYNLDNNINNNSNINNNINNNTNDGQIHNQIYNPNPPQLMISSNHNPQLPHSIDSSNDDLNAFHNQDHNHNQDPISQNSNIPYYNKQNSYNLLDRISDLEKATKQNSLSISSINEKLNLLDKKLDILLNYIAN